MRYYVTNDNGDCIPLDVLEISRDYPSFNDEYIIPHWTITGKAIGEGWRSAYHISPLATIKKVIFNNPATIVLWADGTKTVVKCQEGDTYSREQGLALCIAKKYFGNKSNFNNEFKRWLNE